MVDEARSILADHGHIFRYAVLDAQAVPFSSGIFDRVVANHMLYHVPNVAAALSETQRVLRTRGRLCATTNGPAHLIELRTLIAEFDQRLAVDWQLGARSFDLENGAAQLSIFFNDVVRYHYRDAFVVPDVDAIVAYVSSMRVGSAIAARLDEFRDLVECRLATSGALRVTRDSGLFVAVRR
jgi:ubiquinone/menaquinone biosynthesis C-methylase UbiE